VADVNVTDEYAWTPLHLASKLGNTGTVKALLASGAKVNVIDKGARDTTGSYMF
jgi:ankyrin repeat protein